MASPWVAFQDWEQAVTLGARLGTLALAMGLLGAFALPWVQIDGLNGQSSGISLVALSASSTFGYLYAVSPVQAAVLVGSPMLIGFCWVFLAWSYVRRRTATWATAAIGVVAAGLPYGVRPLMLQDEPNYYTGLSLIVGISVVLLAQQLLIKLRSLLMRRQQFPVAYRALGVVTGSGRYKWQGIV